MLRKTYDLVEAPGLEPGSKEGSAKASTSVSCNLFLGLSVSYRRDTSAPVRRESSSVDEHEMTSEPVKMTPVSVHTGGERADAPPN